MAEYRPPIRAARPFYTPEEPAFVPAQRLPPINPLRMALARGLGAIGPPPPGSGFGGGLAYGLSQGFAGSVEDELGQQQAIQQSLIEQAKQTNQQSLLSYREGLETRRRQISESHDESSQIRKEERTASRDAAKEAAKPKPPKYASRWAFEAYASDDEYSTYAKRRLKSSKPAVERERKRRESEAARTGMIASQGASQEEDRARQFQSVMKDSLQYKSPSVLAKKYPGLQERAAAADSSLRLAADRSRLIMRSRTARDKTELQKILTKIQGTPLDDDPSLGDVISARWDALSDIELEDVMPRDEE